MTTLNLERLPGRCPTCAFHIETQGCRCPDGEWSTFLSALDRAQRSDGTVHACDMRPLTRDRIESRQLSSLWKRAKRERLLTEVGIERSNDVAGKNVGRPEPYYAYSRSAAA